MKEEWYEGRKKQFLFANEFIYNTIYTNKTWEQPM